VQVESRSIKATGRYWVCLKNISGSNLDQELILSGVAERRKRKRNRNRI